MKARCVLHENNWKDIPGYEGLYRVNPHGEIWSLISNKKLQPSFSHDGYKQFNLHKEKKAFIMMAHRAVATTFIPNPDNLPCVNHKDENKLNNDVDNLEWCTYRYNNMYRGASRKRASSFCKKVKQYDKDGNLIAIHNSLRDAADAVGESGTGNISDCCNHPGMIHTVKGYVFSYHTLTKDEILKRFDKKSDTGRLNRKKKCVEQRDMNGKIVRQFQSVSEAAKYNHISRTQIARAARGYEKGYSCHGYKWRYM